MDRCPHYKTEAKISATTPVRTAVVQKVKAIYRWCTHAASPVNEKRAKTSITGYNTLKCGGDVTKCQVPPHLRARS